MLALALSWSVAAILGLVIVRDYRATDRPPPPRGRPTSRSRSRQPSLPPGCRLLPPGVSARRGGRHASRIPVGRDQDRVRRDAGRSSRAAGMALPHAYRLGVSSNAAARLVAEGRRTIVALVVCVGTLGLLTPELLVVIGDINTTRPRPQWGSSRSPCSRRPVHRRLARVHRAWTADMGAAVMAGVARASRPTSLSPRRWARRAPQAGRPWPVRDRDHRDPPAAAIEDPVRIRECSHLLPWWSSWCWSRHGRSRSRSVGGCCSALCWLLADRRRYPSDVARYGRSPRTSVG